MASAQCAPPYSEHESDSSQPPREQIETYPQLHPNLPQNEIEPADSHYQSYGYAPPQLDDYQHYQPNLPSQHYQPDNRQQYQSHNRQHYQSDNRQQYQPDNRQHYQSDNQQQYQPDNRQQYQPDNQQQYQPDIRQQYQPDNQLKKHPDYNSPGPSGYIPSSRAATTASGGNERYRTDEPLETEHVGSYLFWSIFNFLCCCWILGLIAVITSIMARFYNMNEKTEMAKRYSRAAFGLNIAGTVIGVIIIISLLALNTAG